MFDTEQFRQSLMREAAQAVREQNIDTYDERIIDLLQFLATANEEHLLLLESRRPQFQRRGMTEAIKSASTLLSEAAAIARAAERRRIMVNDLRESYKARFCQVWPFCR